MCVYIQGIVFEKPLRTKHYTSIWDTLGSKKDKRCGLDQGASNEGLSNGQTQHIKIESTRFIERLDVGCETEESRMIPRFSPTLMIDLKDKQLY